MADAFGKTAQGGSGRGLRIGVVHEQVAGGGALGEGGGQDAGPAAGGQGAGLQEEEDLAGGLAGGLVEALGAIALGPVDADPGKGGRELGAAIVTALVHDDDVVAVFFRHQGAEGAAEGGFFVQNGDQKGKSHGGLLKRLRVTIGGPEDFCKPWRGFSMRIPPGALALAPGKS